MTAAHYTSLQPDLTDFQEFQKTQLDRRTLVHAKGAEWSQLDQRQFEKEDAFLKGWDVHYNHGGRFPSVFRTIFCRDQAIWNSDNPTRYQYDTPSKRNRNAKETTLNRVNERLKLWDEPHYLQDPDSRNRYYLDNMHKLFLWPYEDVGTWVTQVTEGFKEHKIKRFRRQPADTSQYQVTYMLPHQLHDIPSYGELEPPEYLQSGLSPDGDQDCHPPKFIDFDRIGK